MKRAVIVTLCFTLFVLICFPIIIEASGSSHDGHGESGHAHVPWYRGFNLWKTINLGLLFFALFYFLSVPIKRLLHERSFAIEKRLSDAENDKKEARSNLELMQKRFSEAKREIDEILEKGRDDAQKAIESINQNKQGSIEMMKKRAKDDLEQEFIAARQDLQSFVASEAVNIARQKIEKLDLTKLQSSYLNKFQEAVKLQGGNGEGS